MTTVFRKRPISRRLAALWMATVFLLAGAREGLAGYHCSQHSGTDSAAGMAAGGGHHGHHATAQTEHSGHSESDGTAAPEPCDCVGACQIGQSVAPPPALASTVATFVEHPTERIVDPSTWTPTSPEFLLPYANGPPSLG